MSAIVIHDSKSLSDWIRCCIHKHVKGDKTMTRDQCIAAAHKKFGVSKDLIEDLIVIEDSIPSCVFTRMGCIEKKYPGMFTLKDRLNLAHDFCLCHHNEQDFGNGSFFRYIEDLVGSKNIKQLVEYQTLKALWEEVRTLGAPVLYDKKKDIEYEGKLYLKKLKKEDFLIEDVKPYYGTKIGTGETSAEKTEKKMREVEQQRRTPMRGNLPEEAVTSSTVLSRSVRDNKLYLRFHSSPQDSYKYLFGSNEEALQAADDLTKESPGRYVWRNLRGKELGPVFGKPSKLTPGGTSASIIPYDKSKYTRIKQYMGRVPELEKRFGSIEELAEKMRQFKMGVKEEKAPSEEKERGELEAGGTSGAPIRPTELQKYQRRIYEEKQKRREAKEKAKSMLEELRKKRFRRDLVVEDSFDELLEWIEENIDLKEGWTKENVAWAIVNSKKKKETWRETWDRIGTIFDKRREKREKEDFILLDEIIELEQELAHYEFRMEDHINEFITYIKEHETIEND